MVRFSGTEGSRELERVGPKAARLFRVLAVLAAIALAPAVIQPALAAQVTVSWDTNVEPDLAGYRVHYGTTSGTYTVHLDVGNVLSRLVDTLNPGTTYYFAVTAYDTFGSESAYSTEVAYTLAPAPETISQPTPPAGPASGVAGTAYTYSTGGALSSNGDPVQYQFSWADGTVSGWLPVGTVSAAKAWSVPGTYGTVSVQARCATHPSVVSAASLPSSVTITAAAAETVSRPFTPSGPASGIVGIPYVYTTGGSVTSLGDPVQYQFSWSDGTVSGWLPVGTTSAAKTWSAASTYTNVYVEARCATHPSVVSSSSSPLSVTIAAGVGETLSMPASPVGPASGVTGIAYVFSSSGAVSSTGDPVQYRFSWGDGTVSAWSTNPTATKVWSVPGTYAIQVEASCSLHPSISSLSAQAGIAVAAGNNLLFSDNFRDGTINGDPDWQPVGGTTPAGGAPSAGGTTTVTANWPVEGTPKSVVSPPSVDGALLVRSLLGFSVGRLESRFKLTRTYAVAPNAGVVFSYTNGRHYRYVTLTGNKVVLGQVGATASETAGVKRSAYRSLALGVRHKVQVDLHTDGTTRVFLNGGQQPVLSYRFRDVVPGMVGYLSQTAKTYYGDFFAWDQTVLSPDVP